MFNIIFDESLWTLAITFSTALFFVTLGGYISNRAGIINIGLEGIMLMGALFGVLISVALLKIGLPSWLPSWFSSLSIGAVILILVIVFGFIMGAVIGLLHLKMGSDIGLTGIIINITAVGLTIFIMFLATNGQKGNTQSLESFVFPRVDLPLIKDVPVLRIISGHNILTYIAVLSIFAMRYVINKTRFGMRVRAVGSSPEAVSSVGLSVNKYKILAIGISGALAALGGVALSMAQVSFFSNNMTVGKGFVGLSASTMGVHPIGGALVAFMFGFVEAFGLKLQINHSVPIQLITMLPYLILIIALIISRYIKIKRRSRIRIRGKK